MTKRDIGSARTFGTLLTRSSARERSGLSRWEAEGGALAPAGAPLPPDRATPRARMRQEASGRGRK